MSRPLLMIACYAAKYGGNFIRSVSALAGAYDGDVTFLLPEAARDKKWLDELGDYAIEFASFTNKGLHDACAALGRKCGRDVIVHVHFLTGLSLRTITAEFPNVLCHWHMAVDPPVGLKNKMIAVAKRAVFSTFYPRARFIAVSEPVAASLREEYPMARVECVPNAIDFSRYVGRKVDARNRPNRPIRALIFGSHFERKAIDVAMAACDRLAQRGYDVVLTVATHSPCECREKVAAIRGDVPSWMHIIPVMEDVASLYESADLFLSPSRSEAFGYAVVEGAYMGCGVVASDVPGQNTLKCIQGIQWVHPEDPDGLADAMLASVGMLTSRAQVVLDALRSDLECQYGIDSWVEQILNIYSSIG